jgi:hypothetical protein
MWCGKFAVGNSKLIACTWKPTFTISEVSNLLVHSGKAGVYGRGLPANFFFFIDSLVLQVVKSITNRLDVENPVLMAGKFPANWLVVESLWPGTG